MKNGYTLDTVQVLLTTPDYDWERYGDVYKRQGREIAAIHPNMVVKIPMTVEGLKAVKALSLIHI